MTAIKIIIVINKKMSAQEGSDRFMQQIERNEAKDHYKDGCGEEKGRVEDARQDDVW
jgi:hypothetical protein